MSYCPTYWQSLGCLESFISFNYIKKALVPIFSWMTTTREWTWKVVEGIINSKSTLFFWSESTQLWWIQKKSTKSPFPKRQLKIPRSFRCFFQVSSGLFWLILAFRVQPNSCPRCFSIPMGRWRKPAKSEKSVEPPERRPSQRSLESMFPFGHGDHFGMI